MKRFIYAVIITCLGVILIGLNTKEHKPALPEESPVSVVQPAPEAIAPETVPEPIQPVEPVVEPVQEPQPVYTPPVYSGTHEDWMAQAGIAPSDYGYVDYIVNHESSWRATVTNSIGAHGLCQSLPGNKMASAGADWYDNPITQLKWCNNYAVSRYGSWASAYQFWVSNRWW